MKISPQAVDEYLTAVTRADIHEPGNAQAFYSVGVRLDREGHVCASLNWVDMGSRRSVTQKLSCYLVPGVSRLGVLYSLAAAVTEAILDEEAGPV